MNVRTALLALVLVLLVPACTKDRSTFSTGWKAAVQTKDGRAAFGLLDRATRDKIVAGLKKSQEKAAKDEEFKKLFAAANAPADTTRPPEELAAAAIAAQLAEGGADVTDDGKTTQIHLEEDAWRMAAEPVGFVDPDGAPVTLRLRFPGVRALQPAGGSTSYRVQVEREGKTFAQIHEAQTKALARVVELAHLDADGYAAAATKILDYYASMPEILEPAFELGSDGSLTAVYKRFDPQLLNERLKQQPTLAFGVWK
jgi:hypothetical protein